MRLEKIMYEKVFNNKLLGRAREISKPSLAYKNTNFLLTQFPSFGLRRVYKVVKDWFRKMEWWWMHDQTDRRGIAMEDICTFKGWELRRDVLNEHIFRESLHPFLREMIRYRHLRFQKVEDAVMGFEAPDYIREEVRKRTFIQGMGNMMTWRHFYQQNYENDQTPISTMFHNSRNILEIVYLVGGTERNAWNRYFFNEKHYYTVDTYLEENRFERKLKLTEPADLDEFISRCEKANEKFPGMYAPPGQKVDREEIKRAIEDIIDQTGWKDLTSEEFKDYGLMSRTEKTAFVQPTFEGEDKTGKNNVGLDYPAFLKRFSAKGFFN